MGKHTTFMDCETIFLYYSYCPNFSKDLKKFLSKSQGHFYTNRKNESKTSEEPQMTLYSLNNLMKEQTNRCYIT
jgi:hypothetical protein